MSAVETTVVVPETNPEEHVVAPAVEVAPTDATAEVVAPPAEEKSKEEVKLEDSVPTESTPVTAEASENKPDEPATEEKTEVPEVKKEERPKSPGFLAKILAPFNHKSKSKVPKSPKKEKKEADAVAITDEPAKEDAAPVESEAAGTVKAEEVTPEPTKDVEPVIEATQAESSVVTDTSAVKEKADATDKEEEKKETKAIKVGRRLSSRVGNFFKPKAKEDVSTPAKVDENPPKIDEPAPVAPLENPVENKVEEVVAQEPAPVEASPAAPVVAAAA